jgi:hypothetical protein
MNGLDGQVVDEDLLAQVMHVPHTDQRQHPPTVTGRALSRGKNKI